MILFLLLVTATFRPPAPTVGDPITIEFPAPVVLDPSPAYEVVSGGTTTFIIRSFDPKPFALSGQMGNIRFRNLIVPMKSVLQPMDSMEPAPLRPPVSNEPSRVPLIAIAAAAAIAALAWAGVVLLARRLLPRAAEPPMPPVEKFRAAVRALRSASGEGRWAGLADASRQYIAAMDSSLGEELTTSELLRAMEGRAGAPTPLLAEILRQGDLEKFSPWGSPPGDFLALADRALAIPDFFEPPPPAEEEVAA